MSRSVPRFASLRLQVSPLPSPSISFFAVVSDRVVTSAEWWDLEGGGVV